MMFSALRAQPSKHGLQPRQHHGSTRSLHAGSCRRQHGVRVRVVAQPECDFYSILGVSPVADAKTIKVAYYNLMREYHPDQNAATAAASNSMDTNEFCALLNEIYRTLSDTEARAVYDAIAGFTAGATNPFQDASYPADQVFVDEVSCIGCGKCVRACGAAFLIEDSKYGRARVVPGANVLALEEEIQVAIETCPVDCIHWVSSPQLTLLENALAGMSRVDAFIMMRQARAPGNVFEEANRSWNKRQATIASRRRQHEAAAAAAASAATNAAFNSANSWGAFWSQYVEFKPPAGQGQAGSSSSSSSQDESQLGDRSARKVADLAASAARAMRRWQLHRRVASPQKALTD